VGIFVADLLMEKVVLEHVPPLQNVTPCKPMLVKYCAVPRLTQLPSNIKSLQVKQVCA